MTDMNSDYMVELHEHLPKEMKFIPKPFFLTNLFLESPVAVCRPLFPPFDRFAITHYGEVFCYRPLKLLSFDTDIKMIDPTMVISPTYTPSGRLKVLLQNIRTGVRKSYLIDRIMLERFYRVGLYERVEVEHLDGIETNNHINNLVAHYVASSTSRPHIQDSKKEPGIKALR